MFARLADRHLATVRWFVWCDGRAGVRFDSEGGVEGPDDCFWRDLEAGIEEAARADLQIIPTLFDFPWCRRGRIIDGVRCGGHRQSLSTADGRGGLIERLVVPTLRRCAREPAIAAWDIINEPEWITWGSATLNPLASVGRAFMREFIREAAAAVHAETRHPATVGLASWRGLGLVKDLGLDVYQVHWYDRRERLAPLERSIAAELDRPLWLGEFPTAGSRRTSAEIVAAARKTGYSAALAWSAEAVDPWSNLDSVPRPPV